MLSDERLREMLAGTEGVTPGPWFVGREDDDDSLAGSTPIHSATWGAFARAITTMETGEPRPRNVAHIAACDPDTIRSILTELLSLRAANAKMAEALENAHGFLNTPISRRRNEGDGFYATTAKEVADALALHRGDAKP